MKKIKKPLIKMCRRDSRCGGDVAFSVGMTTVSTILSPIMTPLMVSLLASGTNISIKALPMLVSIVEKVILPVALGFLLNYLLGKKKMFSDCLLYTSRCV